MVGRDQESGGAGDGPFAFISRRRALKWTLTGLGGMLGMTAAAGGALLSLRGCAPEVAGLEVLSDHEYRTLSALARTVVPRGGPFAAGADDVGLARLFDGYLADEPAQNVRELSLALTLVELGPVLFDGRLRTFSNLPPADQLAHWGSWSVSETLIRRKASIGFNKFFNLVFYGQPAIWPHLGYVDPAP